MQAQQLVNGNFLLSKAGLTGLAGAATTFTTGVGMLYALAGKAFNKPAVAGGVTPITDAATGKAIVVLPGTGTVVLWCLDAAGNVKLVQGSAEPLEKDGTLFQFAPPQFPLVDDSLVPFAYSVHKVVTTGAAFTVGVSQWSAAGASHTVQDIITLPGRPQIA